MTQFYARYSANWDNAPGGHSPDTIWNTAADGSGSWGTPGVGDSCEANGYTVAINIDIDIGTGDLTNANSGGFTLVCTGTKSLTANFTSSATPVLIGSGAGGTITFNGNMFGGSSNAAYAAHLPTSTTYIINGNVTAGSSTSSGLYYSNSTVTINGDVTSTATSAALLTGSSHTTTINGCVAGTANYGVLQYSGYGTLVLGATASVVGANNGRVVLNAGIVRWNVSDGGTLTLYDSTTAAHVLKVPDYPAVGLVADGTSYDYTAMEGTRIDCPVNSALRTGTAYYGNPASLVDGNYYAPNDGESPYTSDASLVLDTGYFGVGNATQGTAEGGGGYTYGDEDASKVLTTATGAGTYQAVATANVRAGTAVGVSPAVGTLDLPAEADVKDGVLFDGETKEGEYPTTAATQAADAAALTAKTLDADGTDTDVAFGASTGTAKSGAVYSAGYSTGHDAGYSAGYSDGYTGGVSDGRANQLQTDIDEASTFQAYMTTDVVNLLGTISGNLDMSLYVLKSYVVSAAYVVTGNDNYAGGSPGTYPTTATSKAEQLATDKAAVTAAVAGILDSVTILTHTGTYHEATTAEVQDGVMFGPSSTYEGTYAGGGGGPLVGPSALVS